MTRAAIATLATALLLTTTAMGQDEHKGNEHGGPSGQHGEQHGGPQHGGPNAGGQTQHGGQPGGNPQFRQNNSQQNFNNQHMNVERHENRHVNAPTQNGPVQTGPNGRSQFEQRRTFTNQRTNQRGTNQGTGENRNFSRENRNQTHTVTTSHRFGSRPANWNNRPRTFNRSTYARSFTAQHRFHYGNYNRPSGWTYRRWNHGQFLPRLFFAQTFWLNDWWLFDLPIPPYGYEWVRYGDDALLVNIDTGEILQVEYDVFY